MSNACGIALASARRFAGLALREVSDAVDLSIGFLNDCEHGSRHPRPELVVKLAHLYSADAAELLVLLWSDTGEVRFPFAAAHPEVIGLAAMQAARYTPPAEAARDDSDGGDHPPLAPVATSRVASAGEKRKSRVSTRWCSPPSHSLRSKGS